MFESAWNSLQWQWYHGKYFEYQRQEYESFEDWVNDTPLFTVLEELADFEEPH